LKDIINDKEYIKSLREKSNKDYKEYLKKIVNYTENVKTFSNDIKNV